MPLLNIFSEEELLLLIMGTRAVTMPLTPNTPSMQMVALDTMEGMKTQGRNDIFPDFCGWLMPPHTRYGHLIKTTFVTNLIALTLLVNLEWLTIKNCAGPIDLASFKGCSQLNQIIFQNISREQIHFDAFSKPTPLTHRTFEKSGKIPELPLF